MASGIDLNPPGNAASTRFGSDGVPWQGGRLRFLMVSYAFGAAAEVGARRINAIAAHLATQGHAVDVIYGEEPTASAASRQLFQQWSAVRLFPVRDPPGQVTRRLVATKKGLQRLLEGKTSGSADPESTAELRELGDMLVSATGRFALPAGSATGEFQLAATSSTGRFQVPPSSATGRFQLALAALTRWPYRAYMSSVFSVNGKKRWARSALLQGVRLGRQNQYDGILSSGPPAVGNVVAAWLSARIKVPLAIDLRDPWNTNDMIGEPLAVARWLDQNLERNCLNQASLITCAAPGIQRRAATQHPKLAPRLHLVLNGFDDCDRTVRPMPFGRLNLLYAGLLYLQRNPFPLLEALGRLVSRPEVDRSKVRFTLIGHCESWGGVKLAEWCREAGMDDLISVRAPVPRQELSRLRETANVLVNFSQGQPEQIPAKTFEMLASRRYLLTVTEDNSDTAKILRAAHVLGVVDDRVPEALDRALKDLYTRLVAPQWDTPNAAQSLVNDIDQFSRARQNAVWYELLLRTFAAPAKD